MPADCTVEFAPHAGNRALSVPFDTPWLSARQACPGGRMGHRAVLIGGGGSIPVMGDVRDILGLEPLMIGFSLEDDRIHSPNEKYDLSTFHGGIRSWARILAAIAEGWKAHARQPATHPEPERLIGRRGAAPPYPNLTRGSPRGSKSLIRAALPRRGGSG